VKLRTFGLLASFITTTLMFIHGLYMIANLYYVEFKTPRDENQTLPSKESTKNLSYITPPLLEDGGCNILLLGGDDINQNTDTIILSNLNFGEGTIHFLSIPRDTRIEKLSASYKINAAYPMGGGERTSTDLEDLLDIKICYYIYFDTQSFRTIIDILGGVEFIIPEDLYYNDPLQDLVIQLNKGLQVLDGEQSESFFRFRQFNSGKVTENYDGSDLYRIKNQQNFIKELIKQKANVQHIHKLRDIVAVLFQNLDTNMPVDFILKASNYFKSIPEKNLLLDTLPGTSEYIDKTWYYIPDHSSSKKMIQKQFQRNHSF
jgi:polyisoprenyl-teichoic acid--peptidoglycan teichoic acid transferase